MPTMPLEIDWTEIGLRLVVTLIAGALVGLNREEQGGPAGLRTNILVCLAASLSMIEVNLLLSMKGRPDGSFVMNDLMRFPLGILTGVGFIGGGVILKRDKRARGITTAATIWFVTVVGLCIGAGFKTLGLLAVVVAILILWALKRVERALPLGRKATLSMTVLANGPDEDFIRSKIHAGGYGIDALGVDIDNTDERRNLTCDVHWRAVPTDIREPPFVAELAALSGVSKVKWMPHELTSE
jgi:putative Mg2+ transporter-C (MgtC) family protein